MTAPTHRQPRQRDDRRAAAPFLALCILLTAAATSTAPAAAQTGGCAPSRTLPNGAIELDCGAGLTIVVEATTRWRVEGPAGRPDRLVVDRGAALVDFDRPGTGFQIQTPRAIASVRGTTWAVDVTAAATAVLTLSGAVAVTRRAGGEGVVLRPGEGVDVGAGSTRLQVFRWGTARVQRLLARLGR